MFLWVQVLAIENIIEERSMSEMEWIFK